MDKVSGGAALHSIANAPHQLSFTDYVSNAPASILASTDMVVEQNIVNRILKTFVRESILKSNTKIESI